MINNYINIKVVEIICYGRISFKHNYYAEDHIALMLKNTSILYRLKIFT